MAVNTTSDRIRADDPGTDRAPEAKPRRARTERSDSRQRLLLGLAGTVGLIIVLEIVSRAGLVDPQFLPPFSTVVWTLITLFGNPTFLVAVGVTVGSFLLGLFIAAVVGIVLGVIFGLSDTVYRATRPVVELIRPLPPVALIPLMILVLGSGLQMKLAIVVFACVWPILFNTMYGIHDVEPLQKEMARSFGKNRWQVLWQIIIPAAAPFIATGVRIASSVALIVMIAAELVVGGTDGIGAFIARARESGTQVDWVYAGILMAGLLGLAINLFMGAGERKWFSWQTTTKEG